MSWQPYVDNNLVGSGKICQAAIYGLDGGQWAASTEFALSPEEFQSIKSGFDKPDDIRASGIHINGKKYFVLSGEDGSIHGKLGATGVICSKTTQTIIIGHYDENTQPGEANKVVASVSDYLKSVGY